MSDRTAFIDAILNNPNDDTARLVFADWLEEHGEPERAEFIRAQIEPAKASDAVRERNDPDARIAGVHGAAMGGGWRKAIGISETEGEYVRGFLTDVEVVSTKFLAVAGRALAAEPVTFRMFLPASDADDLVAWCKYLSELVASPLLRAVAKLEARNHAIGAGGFQHLIASPYLSGLREISFPGVAISPSFVKAISNSPAPFALESLALDRAVQFARQRTIRLLASAPRFATLKRLSLRYNRLTDDDIRVLLDSETLPRMLEVDLAGNDFRPREFGRALAERFGYGCDEDDFEEDDEY
ncbi:hypothetical protein GobsT_45630 [Gemmata obscuriglobus]|uniref:TIGR02996 domain-containing protein n=1 Tax=Gemmata obscuriglobus TaxID=114 RepID=UPI00016C56C8|nr:TIGR02996 domain-containing protein [Gemmata obscuriglobus]QEG29765.1 hypothetical protein GobsT_45630 [Gemmata obscuriglobus]VTS09082.1 Repeat-companion domain protein OS=Isosphaera pallida (strain ATCC 43644 / DSM 9630 / IS1B) GN=Isop_0537 PE=4 SV=1 [Gemmata obscuriglobus UQM 2246]